MATFLRKATLADLDDIMQIIDSAKALLKKDGSSQWQNGEPNREMFTADIQRNECYVLTVEGEVAGVTTVYEEADPNYATLRDGNWENNDSPYATFHRVAISNKYRGQHLTDILFTSLFTTDYEKGFRYVLIDTQRRNERLQHIAEKWGFKYRGVINTAKSADPVDNERLAYELKLF